MSKINELLKSEIPTYTTNLPTDGKEIKFRPFIKNNFHLKDYINIILIITKWLKNTIALIVGKYFRRRVIIKLI